MSMPRNFVDSVCRLGQGQETCAFLMFGGGWSCAKGTEIEPVIRSRLAEGSFVAQGDHCRGWISIGPLWADLQLAQDAAFGDSNDEEIDLLRSALRHACSLLDLPLPDPNEGEEA